MTMVRDAGKVVAEADVEVSEAIDMARRYARDAIALDDIDAVHRPVGPVVVAPPWNFPLAIPAGGVLAAHRGGQRGDPQARAGDGRHRVAAGRRACGTPAYLRDLVPFLPCPDDEVGRGLITHDGVGAVILTGALATAQLFVSWRPDLRLHAETSGQERDRGDGGGRPRPRGGGSGPLRVRPRRPEVLGRQPGDRRAVGPRRRSASWPSWPTRPGRCGSARPVISPPTSVRSSARRRGRCAGRSSTSTPARRGWSAPSSVTTPACSGRRA